MIQITYNPASIEDFKEAVRFMKEQGGLAPVTVRPTAAKEEENGPFVRQFLQEKGQERFRLNAGERDLMESKGYTREDIAKIRLGLLTPDEESPDESESPKSKGYSAFFDEDEEEEQLRRDEKHGLYGGKEDSSN